jgi:hypothetical protein
MPVGAVDLVAQAEAALLEAAQQQLIQRGHFGQPVDGVVKVGVLDAQFNQASLRRMQVVVHRCASSTSPTGR